VRRRKAAPTSDSFKYCCDSLTTPDAHRHQGVTTLDTLQLVQGFHSDDGPGRADRVTQADAAAVWVHALGIHAQLFADGTCLRRKGFVGFNHVHLVDRQTRSFKGHLGSWHGSYSHVERFDASVAIGNK